MGDDSAAQVRAVVLEAWRSTLGPSEPAADSDDFFALGGHSLLLVQMLEQIEGTLGIAVPLDELFPDPTLGNLLALCEQAARSPA